MRAVCHLDDILGTLPYADVGLACGFDIQDGSGGSRVNDQIVTADIPQAARDNHGMAEMSGGHNGILGLMVILSLLVDSLDRAFHLGP